MFRETLVSCGCTKSHTYEVVDHTSREHCYLETCRRLLMIRFGSDIGGMDSLYDGVTYIAPHIWACEEAWKDKANDEWC